MADLPHDGSQKTPTWDGRFGERFDDEVSTKAVAYTLGGVGVMVVVALILMIAMFAYFDRGRLETTVSAPQPAPPLPRLQAHPEAELEAYRSQVDERLESFGWVDEAAGIAHIPIDDAIGILVERGLPQVTPLQPADESAEAESPAAATEGEEGEP